MMTYFRTLIFTLLFCSAIYPMAIWLIAQSLTPHTANGSLIVGKNGQLIGSEIIGQNFISEKYFWPRLSAVNFNATTAGGSNLAPTNKKVLESAQDRIKNLKVNTPIPSDLLTSSGSGLDPHISIESAYIQVPRIAKARNSSTELIEKLIDKNKERSGWQFLPTYLVNVLKLNLALDGK
jgi:potassium-transporting ATPase KdpC subunit